MQIIDKVDFGAFQETHGSSVLICDMFRKYQVDKHVAWSSFESPSALTLDMQNIQLGSISCEQSSKKKSEHDDNWFF